MKKFECVKCGNCCRQGGDLRLLPDDVTKIARYFGVDADELKKRYEIKNIDEKLFFIPFTEHCPFLSVSNKCILHGYAKPFFCANYIPFVDSAGSPIYDVCCGIGRGREWSGEEVNLIYNKLLAKLVIRR